MDISLLLGWLMTFSPSGKMEDWEYPLIQGEITNLQQKGWTDSEIISKLRWVEHVNPDVDEDTALRNMKRVEEQVALRLASAT